MMARFFVRSVLGAKRLPEMHSLMRGICSGRFFQPLVEGNFFVVSLTYKVPIEEVEKHLSAHISFLENCYEQGVFVASGRKVPRTGGVIIASAKSREALDEMLSKDPFYQQGVAEYDVTEFVPGMQNPDFLKIRPSVF